MMEAVFQVQAVQTTESLEDSIHFVESVSVDDNSKDANEEAISYTIDTIVDSKSVEDGKVLYKVRWVGYTWVPEEYLQSFQDLIQSFWNERDHSKREENDCNNPPHFTIQSVDNSATLNSTSASLDVTTGTCDSNVSQDVSAPNSSADVRTTCKHRNPRIEKCRNRLSASVVATSKPQTIFIDEASQNSIPRVPVIVCDCGSRFFLKSNYQVHSLFCKTLQNASVSDEVVVVTPDNNLEVSSVGGNCSSAATVSCTPARKEDVSESTGEPVLNQESSFEYVPPQMNTQCRSCAARFPQEINEGSREQIRADSSILMANCSKKVGNDGTEIYQCLECCRDFLYKHPQEKVHPRTRSETVVRPYKCAICSRSFDSDEAREKHELNHSSTNARYTCASCSLKFKTRDQLQEHYDRNDTKCAPFQCKLCKREFVHSNHLKRHMSIHAGVKPFVCDICGHKFNQKSDLLRHEKRHSMDGKLTCGKCVREFETAAEMRAHIREHKRNSHLTGSFTCEQCHRTFGRKSHYKRHMSVHLGVKPYMCESCGKSFNQRTDLKRHELSHARKELRQSAVPTRSEQQSQQPSVWQCAICRKVFADETQLKEHEVLHQRIMRYED